MDVVEAVADAIRLRKAKSAALRQAVSTGDSDEVVRQLVKWGMHSEGFTLSGGCPLLHAARTGQSVILGLLLVSGVDVNRVSGELDSTALHVAAECRQVEVVWQLLAGGADPRKANLDGQTSLHSAVKGGSTKVVARLVHAGADLDARDALGDTPLSIAVEHANFEVVSLLLFAGANPDAEGRDKNTPMHTAAARGELEAVTALLRAGAHPSPRRADTGETPLFLAAREGFARVVQELLLVGARANEKTNDGLTPFDVAKRRGHHLVTRQLGPALYAAGGRQDRRKRGQRGPKLQAAGNDSEPRDGLSRECSANLSVEGRPVTGALEDRTLYGNRTEGDTVDGDRSVVFKGGVRIAGNVATREGGGGEGKTGVRGSNEACELDEVIRACLAVRPFSAKNMSACPATKKSPRGEATRKGETSPRCGESCLDESTRNQSIDSREDTATESVLDSSVDEEYVRTNALTSMMRSGIGARNQDLALEATFIAQEPIAYAEYVKQDTSTSSGSFLHNNKLWDKQHGGGGDHQNAEGLGGDDASRRQDIRRNAVWTRLKLVVMGQNRKIGRHI